ncbi:MAG: hydrolase [Deltaproteobacteria bacterium]|nr:hydrolase [Deltaproteobacteria bacterium]
MILEDADQLLQPGYLPLETGFTRLPSGQILVAVLTRLPRCKGKMIDWWFGYAGDTEKYRQWHPHQHVSGEWDEHWRPGHYIGASHLVREYVGGTLCQLKITFQEPSLLLDTCRFEEARVGAAICGRIGLMQKDFHLGTLIHLVRDTDFGCEMRSRFWLLYADEPFARGVMTHCIEEMGYLGDLLPDLYAGKVGDPQRDVRSPMTTA